MFFIILCYLCCLSIAHPVFASENVTVYKCPSFSVNTPENFTVDDSSIDNFVSFYGDNVTIGLSVTDNADHEDVSIIKEKKIAEIIKETVSSLTDKTGAGIVDAGHSIVSFSSNNYPALYISYTGSNSILSDIYIEEYIITTEEYKYTIVISAESEKDLAISGVNIFKDSFTSYGHTLVQKEPADRTMLIIIFIVALLLVTAGGFFVIKLIYNRN